MKILLKNTFRNILLKPFRTIVIVLAVYICAIVALLCFDFSGAVKSICRALLSDGCGNVELSVAGDIADDFPSVEEVGENENLRYCYRLEKIYKPVENEYSYIKTSDINVVYTDLEIANRLEVLKVSEYPSSDNMLFVTEDFAEEMGYEVGDIMILHDYNAEEHEFIVEKILPSEECNGLFAQDCVLVTKAALAMLNGGEGKLAVKWVDIHLLEDRDVTEIVDMLNNTYPNYIAMSLSSNATIDEVIDNIAKLIYIIFAIVILMTFFITNSLSEKIVSERMQLVGTYRSLGIGSKVTTEILLLENAVYALVGSVPACVTYMLFREGIEKLVMKLLEINNLKLNPLNPLLIFGIIVGALILECVCPIKEVLKAVSTPIRDIIFSNKDTEYRNNKITTVIGVICLGTGIAVMPFMKSMVSGLVSIICLTVALFLLYPYFCRFVSGLLSKLAGKMNKPLAMLAFREVYSKKSTVGSGVLISTAVALLVCVVLISGGFIRQMKFIPFTSDVRVMTGTKESYFSYFDRLEGVTDIEKLYSTIDKIAVEDEKSTMCDIYMIPEGGYKYYPSLAEDENNLNDDEILINRFMASKYNLKTGDTVKIKFKPDGLFPVEKEFKVSGFISEEGASSQISSIGLNENTYFMINSREPSQYLIKSDNPQKTADDINRYSYSYIDDCKTYEEEIDDCRENGASVVKGVGAVVAVVLGVIFIGVVSNFLIGFDGRKRECAVMCSTAMSKGKLKKMLFFESLFASGIAIFGGILVGILMALPLKTAVTSLMLGLAVKVNLPVLALIAVIFWIIFTSTAFFVMRLISKMKIAMQLKYE